MTATFDDPVTRRRAARLSGLLAVADAAPRDVPFPAARITAARAAAARASVVRWRVAAAAVLAAGSLALPPVRLAIAEAAQRVWALVAERPATAVPPAPAPPPVPDGRTSALTFPSPEESFVLRIAVRQASGILTVETVESPDASVAASRAGAEFVVMPDGLRIVNDPADSAGYLLRLPAGLSRVTVLVGREDARVFHPGSGTRIALDLGRTRGAGALQR